MCVISFEYVTCLFQDINKGANMSMQKVDT
jgi:hypothetical protein